MAFFFPQAYTDIDWGRPYEFLDKELQQVVRESKTGRQIVDKLVRVWLTIGRESWILIHIEVQGQKEADFERRMFTYNVRLFDRYEHEVISFAVLTDNQEGWKPNEYKYGRWGFEMRVKFPSVKLLDYQSRWAELETSSNPFAVAVMAHLRTQSTQRKPQERLRWKIEVVRSLYERGFKRSDVLELMRFIDWIMILPAGLVLLCIK